MDSQQKLNLEGASDRARRGQLGHATISYRRATSILTRATGFMGDYDFTLNPYSGCGFGCVYCYAASFSRDEEKRDSWGRWVEVKENAVAVLRRMRTPLAGKSIYMSSATDPYQPIERHLGLVRELLEELAPAQPRLVVQTRSPLVSRDIDLFQRFDHVRVNMTVTTDSERVRKTFEPWCPGNRVRLDAIAEIAAAGLDAGITMTPLLPIENGVEFAKELLATGVRRFVVQPFHAERGSYVAGTRSGAIELVQELGWTPQRYRETVGMLRERLPSLLEGREGFAPA